MNKFNFPKTLLDNINEQNDRINECIDIVNGYTTDEETRVTQEIQRQQNEELRQEQYNNNENRFNEINTQLDNINNLGANILNYKTETNTLSDAIRLAMNISNKLYLPKGNYEFPAGVEIIIENCEIDFNYSIINCKTLFRLKNSTLKNLTINNQIMINGSNSKVINANISPDTPYTINYGVTIETHNDIIENILIENCNVQNVSLFAFNIMDVSNQFTVGEVRNVKYINCKALNTGLENQWSTGFCVEGIKKIEDIEYISCYADNSIESGFHIEDAVSYKNVFYKKCTSTNNGKRKANPLFGCGFFVGTNIILENCFTKGNYNSLYKFDFPRIINHTDNDNKMFSINEYENEIIGGHFDCGLAPFGKYALYSAIYNQYICSNASDDCFAIVDDTSYKYIKNLKNSGSNTAERTIQSNIIKVTDLDTLVIRFKHKRLNGEQGKTILSISEWDINLNKVKSFSLIKEVNPTSEWVEVKTIIGNTQNGKYTSECVLDSNTRYIDIALTFNYNEQANEGINETGVRDWEVIKVY